MSIFWYLIASVGAGVGTGLAGLSAATVMVPILIVLCPSFQGDTGAYQATAIALASDILGSAVTTWTYAKNGHIDLKRGKIMCICILIMCTVGSYAAWLAGDVVLGTFTLFLTFCIGIRFLVSPDTSRKQGTIKGGKLTPLEIAVSLFFGLTIGFGTGFVGTGGGMMMLVVFTVFLGMELKTAVGTSTFIMTFTALIASVSHILIHPAILLEKWHVMLLCVVVATVSSLVSARFANRVDNRTVGLVTGFVLTILGLSMLFLHYREPLLKIVLLRDTLQCLGKLILYLIPCVLGLLLIHFTIKVPSFVFRKLLHMVAFTCVTFMILHANTWQAASLASLSLAAIAYPLLAAVEKESWYSKLFVEKRPGEIKNSLLLLFGMIAVLNAVSAGIFNETFPAVCAILMWGIGDGSAALIGIPFGKHKIKSRFTDGKKSWEGTLAMFFSAFVVGILMIRFFGGHSFLSALLTAFPAAFIAALTELVSSSELDTVTVPTAVLIVLLLLQKIGL